MNTVDFGGSAFNPYAPRPRSVATVAGRLSAGEMLLRRWGGCWIDFILLAAVVFLPVLPFSDTPPDAVVYASLAAAVAYFPVTEGLWGRSLGKLVTGTVVVRADGRFPGIGRAAVRTLLRLIEVNPFFLGGLPAGIVLLCNQERRRLGDFAAGTYVIPVSELKSLQPALVEGVFD
ncbi:MAG TPA: RDD family protein [Caulobacter sp.]|nr:RDD family protein [Caulobacter sp.]